MSDQGLDRLLAELGTLTPTRTRRPVRQLAAVAAISLAYAGALLVAWRLRPDLRYLPRTWLVLYCAAWTVAAATLLWLAMVPASRAVMPRWRLAAITGGVATAAFVMTGLLLPRSVPGVSSIYPETARSLVVHSHWCLRWGLITAAVPIGVGVLALRRALPVGARRIGLALGAGGGALGALFLHLHCPITDRLHLGLVHGGVMLLAGLLTALIAPRWLHP